MWKDGFSPDPTALPTPLGLVWQQVLINPGKEVPHGEFSGLTRSPSTLGDIIPEWENFPAALWNGFPQGEGGQPKILFLPFSIIQREICNMYVSNNHKMHVT